MASEWALAERPADRAAADPVVDGSFVDTVAARVFRLAAVRLARQRPQTDDADEAARDAAKALLSLAASKDDAALRLFLRPDPEQHDATWTVACYQIGDLTPCDLLDFASPAAAVARLVGCGEASHVAAELVASTPTGTRWTAFTRTGGAVRFQLPDRRSASSTTGEVYGELSRAAEHWRAQLSHWAAHRGEPAVVSDPAMRPEPAVRSDPAMRPEPAVRSDAGVRPEPAVRPGPGVRTEPAVRPEPAVRTEPAVRPEADARETALRNEPASRAEPALPAPQVDVPAAPIAVERVAPAPIPGGNAELERALELVITTLKSVEAHTRVPGDPSGEILGRLDALDDRMSELQTGMERAFDRRIQALASYAAELTRSFVAQQSVTMARLEARIEDLASRFPET